MPFPITVIDVYDWYVPYFHTIKLTDSLFFNQYIKSCYGILNHGAQA